MEVLKLRGQKLEDELIEIAKEQEADEFIIGLPKSSDGKETPQSNKVRSVAGRLAVRAADRFVFCSTLGLLDNLHGIFNTPLLGILIKQQGLESIPDG